MKTVRKNGGFTLMEVLAAMLLMAIVLPVVMHGISLSVSVAEVAQHKAEAAELAHSKLTEMAVTREWQSGEMKGDFGEDHPEFHWVAELKEWDTSALKELDVHVFWGSGAREQHVTVSTLVDTEGN